MVDVGGQSEVGVAAPLVCRHHEFAVLYLELHEAQARCLVALRVGGAEEQHVVLAAALFPVDTVYERWQLLEVCRIAVHEYGAAVVPPVDAGFTVFLHVSLALHEELQLAFQFLPRDGMPFEDVEEVGRGEREPLVQEVADVPFPVLLRLSGREDPA